MAPFSVYIHYPFCRSRCGYCSFPTSDPHDAPQGAYADAVLRELEARGLPDGELRTVYVGGGTPSLWRGEHLARVVEAVLAGRRAEEVTVEANPASLRASWLRRLMAAGVDRLSLGVQSTDDEVLALLGRRHTAARALAAVHLARSVGVGNFGCDVIFGLPGQTVEHHLRDLEALAELGPQHISTYGLSLAREAPLRRAGYAPASDDAMAAMMEAGRRTLEAAGYEHYEVSNYCRPDRHSRHNTALWSGHPYVGLGAWAHSADHAGPLTVRRANPGPGRYLALWSGGETPPDHGATVDRVDAAGSRLEALMLGLRTVAGVHRRRFQRRFGVDLSEVYGPQIAALTSAGMVTLQRDRLRPTRGGIWFADELALRITV